MEVFRIAKTKFAKDLSGEGARLFGGRWNKPGMAVLYTSESRSLSLLELIVHFASKATFKDDFNYITLDIENNLIENLEKSYLPYGDLEPNDIRLWKITDYYFLEKKVAAFRVPSVLIPQENNIIVNPNHTELKELKIKHLENVNLDERFKNSLK